MRWTHDKSADDDGKPVNDVIVQFHYIENCRSVLVEIPFVWGITEDPLRIGSTEAPGAINKEQIVVILTL